MDNRSRLMSTGTGDDSSGSVGGTQVSPEVEKLIRRTFYGEYEEEQSDTVSQDEAVQSNIPVASQGQSRDLKWNIPDEEPADLSSIIKEQLAELGLTPSDKEASIRISKRIRDAMVREGNVFKGLANSFNYTDARAALRDSDFGDKLEAQIDKLLKDANQDW